MEKWISDSHSSNSTSFKISPKLSNPKNNSIPSLIGLLIKRKINLIKSKSKKSKNLSAPKKDYKIIEGKNSNKKEMKNLTKQVEYSKKKERS